MERKKIAKTRVIRVVPLAAAAERLGGVSTWQVRRAVALGLLRPYGGGDEKRHRYVTDCSLTALENRGLALWQRSRVAASRERAARTGVPWPGSSFRRVKVPLDYNEFADQDALLKPTPGRFNDSCGR